MRSVNTFSPRVMLAACCVLCFGSSSLAVAAEETAAKTTIETVERLTAEELAQVKAAEASRIATIDKVFGSVVAVYGNNRQGGGSGVIFDEEGYALTNFHVVNGAGVEGWGGLADGKLYRWKLVGMDPGGERRGGRVGDWIPGQQPRGAVLPAHPSTRSSPRQPSGHLRPLRGRRRRDRQDRRHPWGMEGTRGDGR
ncbi:MAG: hypothetical protein IIA67_11950, partial [Planctomycetes bacterium]|nr:hypothetical protein [Planctomycetota bacterium]